MPTGRSSTTGTSVASRTRLAVVAACLALATLVPLGASALAQTTGRDAAVAEVGLTVEVGFEGRVVASRWLPVTVRLDPARAVRGVLVVESRSASGIMRERQAVEVAARTPSIFRLVMPAGRISVSLQEPGREDVTVAAATQTEDRTYLVGMLGGVAEGAPPLRHDPTGLTGAWVGVDPRWLERSPQALDTLDALVAPSGELEALTADGRRALVSAVAAGTDLVVVLPAQGAEPDLDPLRVPARPAGTGGVVQPEENAWTVDGEAGAATAAAWGFGRGRVVATGVAPAAGGGDLWNRILEPGSRTALQPDWAVDLNPRMFASLFGEEGGAPPALPWLAGFALAYVLVVGPVNGLLLARLGRRELAWATVPLVTLVFTAAAFLGVAGGRPPVGDVARLLVSVDGAETEVVAASVRAPTEGTRTMTVRGPGWTARSLVDGGGRATVQQEPGGFSTLFDLRALQPGGLLASRPVTGTSPLRVVAVQRADGSIAVELRNDGAEAIEGVAVRAATARSHVGTLGPGASTVVEVGGGTLPLVPVWSDPFSEMGRLPASLLPILRTDLLDGNPGLVWAVGAVRADGLDPEVVIEGQPARDRGWLAATAVTPTLEAPAGPFVVQRDALVPSAAFLPSPLAVEDAREAFLRLRVPAGSDVGALVADLDRGEGAPTFHAWVPGEREWRLVDEVFDGGRADPAALLGSFGTMWIRASGELFPFDFSGRTVHTLEAGGSP